MCSQSTLPTPILRINLNEHPIHYVVLNMYVVLKYEDKKVLNKIVFRHP
jgi:hypothetical protein